MQPPQPKPKPNTIPLQKKETITIPQRKNPSSNNPRLPRRNTIRAILLWEVNLALDGVGAEALVVRVVAREMAVFPEAEFAVGAGVG